MSCHFSRVNIKHSKHVNRIVQYNKLTLTEEGFFKKYQYDKGHYNLIEAVSFPSRKSKASTTAIDNIFITRTKNYNINPHINGLSDLMVQIITV